MLKLVTMLSLIAAACMIVGCHASGGVG